MVGILICLQLPFTITNLVFAYTQPHSVCMDTPHGGLAVRPWFMGIGYSEVALMLGLLLPILCFKLGCCSLIVFGAFEIIMYVLFALKGTIWFVVELVLFIEGISKYCHGGVYTYGLILVILNFLNLCMGGCCRPCLNSLQGTRISGIR